MTKNPASPTAAPGTPSGISRLERILAIMIVAIVALALICFVAVIVATSAGVGANDGFSHGIWPAVFFVPYLGLPLAFVLIIVVLVSNGMRRSRAAKANAR
ncbi:MAG TPA: hypothetical protein VFS93_05700 [Terrimesophilobacter sp.]|uniref:hypothetical protein n=1 Tax=Leifsonella bigeumensis TaxID=433643 RepID=UPI002DC065D1|nr:hypothetical protein [Terrimesophilobacter sp.]